MKPIVAALAPNAAVNVMESWFIQCFELLDKDRVPRTHREFLPRFSTAFIPAAFNFSLSLVIRPSETVR
jgi:hypothetical protein